MDQCIRCGRMYLWVTEGTCDACLPALRVEQKAASDRAVEEARVEARQRDLKERRARRAAERRARAPSPAESRSGSATSSSKGKKRILELEALLREARRDIDNLRREIGPDTQAAEIERLREERDVAVSKLSAGSEEGIAGRQPLKNLRDVAWPHFLRTVAAIPQVYQREHSALKTLGYIQGTVAPAMHAISLAAPQTPDIVQVLHRLDAQLEEAEASVLFADGRAGERGRLELIRCVELYVLKPAMRAAFEKSNAEPVYPSQGYDSE